MAHATTDDRVYGLVLRFAGIVSVIYGLIFLLFPELQFQLSGDPGAPSNPGWVRWGGAAVVGIGVAAWLAASSPERQRPLVLGFAIAFTLVTLALLYSYFAGEYRGAAWVVWLPVSGTLPLAIAFWWIASRYRAAL